MYARKQPLLLGVLCVKKHAVNYYSPEKRNVYYYSLWEMLLEKRLLLLSTACVCVGRTELET
jgi:hypothetical protein